MVSWSKCRNTNIGMFCKQSEHTPLTLSVCELNSHNIAAVTISLCLFWRSPCFTSWKFNPSYKRKPHLPCKVRAKACNHLWSKVYFWDTFTLIGKNYAKNIYLTLKTRGCFCSNFAWQIHLSFLRGQRCVQFEIP